MSTRPQNPGNPDKNAHVAGWHELLAEADQLADKDLLAAAIERLRDARERACGAGDVQGRAVTSRLLSELYRRTGDRTLAEQHFQLALQAELELASDSLSPEILTLAGRRAAARDNADEALCLFHAASWPTSGAAALASHLESRPRWAEWDRGRMWRT